MTIKKLPAYLINRLKAGEIVERPASVLKELIENSLDAGADSLNIYLQDGGKKRIMVQDNGKGIESSDKNLVLERYATSKIENEKDLTNIQSYGFRGEALATIAEVSKLTLQTKTKQAPIGREIRKNGESIQDKKIATAFEHGTTLIIEDLFFNVPAREKFLKSAQTEYFYCYQVFINTALIHRDKSLSLTKKDKQIFQLRPATDPIQRITDIYKKQREENLFIIEHKDSQHHLYGVTADTSLRFSSSENIKIFVNKRPVQDKIIRRAILDAYNRQMGPKEFPLAILFLEIDPSKVDVNVHPRKSEVKFLDSQSIYQLVKQCIEKKLGENKVSSLEHEIDEPQQEQTAQSHNFLEKTNTGFQNKNYSPSPYTQKSQSFFSSSSSTSYPKTNPSSTGSSYPQTKAFPSFSLQNKRQDEELLQVENYHIIGQLRNMYIVLQDADALYYIDQHALAERIIFEQMKKNQDLTPEPLLQPISIEVGKEIPLDKKIEECNALGFDISLFGENKIIIHAVPAIFSKHVIDLETLFNKIIYSEHISYDIILENIFATKSCKAAIKAGQKLSAQEMQQLVKDGYEHIPGMFVCQHGRPFFIQIQKKNIDKMFDRH